MTACQHPSFRHTETRNNQVVMAICASCGKNVSQNEISQTENKNKVLSQAITHAATGGRPDLAAAISALGDWVSRNYSLGVKLDAIRAEQAVVEQKQKELMPIIRAAGITEQQIQAYIQGNIWVLIDGLGCRPGTQLPPKPEQQLLSAAPTEGPDPLRALQLPGLSPIETTPQFVVPALPAPVVVAPVVEVLPEAPAPVPPASAPLQSALRMLTPEQAVVVPVQAAAPVQAAPSVKPSPLPGVPVASFAAGSLTAKLPPVEVPLLDGGNLDSMLAGF